MIHPFAGIVVPPEAATPALVLLVAQKCTDGGANLEGQSRPAGLLVNRRAVLSWLSSAVVAPWLFARTSEGEEKDENEMQPARQRAMYYVVPKAGKKLTPAVLRKLEINGPSASGWPSRPQYAKVAGHWAWITDATAAKISQDENVEAVEKFTADDVQEAGTPPASQTQTLKVLLAPNSWPGKGPRGTYLAAADVAKQMAKNMRDPKVMFRPAGPDLVLVISNGPITPLVLARIKECPQVVSLTWMAARGVTNVGGEQGGKATTLALGEEGSAPTRPREEHGGATTRALGEEGGQPAQPPGRVTTQAVGEEGR